MYFHFKPKVLKTTHGGKTFITQTKLFNPSSPLTENERFDQHGSPGGDSEGLAEAAEAAGQDGSAEQVARQTGIPFWSPFRLNYAV